MTDSLAPQFEPTASAKGSDASGSAEKSTIVVKIGSTLIANSDLLTPRFGFLQRLMEDIYRLRQRGHKVILCSSGAVALGLKMVGETPENAGVSDKQAAAAARKADIQEWNAEKSADAEARRQQALETLEEETVAKRASSEKKMVDAVTARQAQQQQKAARASVMSSKVGMARESKAAADAMKKEELAYKLKKAEERRADYQDSPMKEKTAKATLGAGGVDEDVTSHESYLEI